jgi:hypothetical protein
MRSEVREELGGNTLAWVLPSNHPLYSDCVLGSADSSLVSKESSQAPAFWVSVSAKAMQYPSSWAGWKTRPWSQRLFSRAVLKSSRVTSLLDGWISSHAGSRASRLAVQPEAGTTHTTCGTPSGESLVRCDRVTFSVRTYRSGRYVGQHVASLDLATTAPTSVSRPPTWVPPTEDSVGGYLPTLTATANHQADSMSKHPSTRRLNRLLSGRLAPANFWEWMMGFRAGWTG